MPSCFQPFRLRQCKTRRLYASTRKTPDPQEGSRMISLFVCSRSSRDQLNASSNISRTRNGGVYTELSESATNSWYIWLIRQPKRIDTDVNLWNHHGTGKRSLGIGLYKTAPGVRKSNKLPASMIRLGRIDQELNARDYRTHEFGDPAFIERAANRTCRGAQPSFAA